MKISIITLFPAMVEAFIKESIIKRAQEKGAVEIECINPREFALDRYGTVDGAPYGGGAGMVMRIEPLVKALDKAMKSEKHEKLNRKIILTSPRGIIFTQKKAQEYSTYDQLVVVAGHYEGVDERVLQYIDEEISIGDYILTGGEPAAAVITDAVVRLLPGVLKKEEATQIESFFEVSVDELIRVVGEDETLKKLKEAGKEKVKLLEYPQYTRPEEFEEKKVPEVLLSGHHAEIKKWQLKESYKQTFLKRPDLLIHR